MNLVLEFENVLLFGKEERNFLQAFRAVECFEQFLPRFRDDDYSGGISAGVGRSALSTVEAPTDIGKVSALPRP